MKISQKVYDKYGCNVSDCDAFDMDSYAFLSNFDAPEGGSVLAVGCHDEATANILSESGFKVVGVDLREYDPKLPACNYEYIRGDFCDPELTFGKFEETKFDAFVSLSAIEHFGYGTYQEGRIHRYYDIIAMRKAWDLLKVGGVAYITVPFGAHFAELAPDWRVYDLCAVEERLIQDFTLLGRVFFTSSTAIIKGIAKPGGVALSLEDAMSYDNPEVPHVTVLLAMKKTSVKRLAPDGR
jgi:SAM-dependent methyltransferase